MKAGDKVRCVDAHEQGIPLAEGQTYTVKAYGPPSRMAEGDGFIKERMHIPCVTLVEVPGYFMATRFEEIPA